MALYRGAGGAGDATNNATSQAILAAASAAQAAASAAAASTSASQAATSATNAASSDTSAYNSATASASSANSASTSATNAANSATAAQTAQTASELAETNAETAEANAETAEANANASASLAQDWATKTSGPIAGGEYSSKYNAQLAATSATNAANSATSASTSASAASTSATNAASSATAAASSASAASTSATNAANSATAASGSATSAASSTSTATTQASNAASSATAAATSASNAATSETNAANSAFAAATSETNAANSASSANTSATNASNSASAAATSATNADASAIDAQSSEDAAAAYAASINPANFLTKANNLSDLTNTSNARTNLGVAIGTNVQAYSSELQAISNGGGNAMFKNRIINGAMMIDKRNAGASFSVGSLAYGIDRFLFQAVTVAGTGQQVTGSTGNNKAIRITGASGNTAMQVSQRIESNNIYDCASQTCTVSFTLSGSTSGSVTVRFLYPTATDNYTSITEPVAGTVVNFTTTATQYSVTRTLDANANKGVWVLFDFGAVGSGVTRTLEFFQLEKGSTATSFDYRPYGTELALCQRYYYLLASGTSKPAGTGVMVGAALMEAFIQFPQEMRATPTLNATSGTDYYNFYRTLASDTFNSFVLDATLPQGTFIYNSSQISGTAGQAGIIYTNNAAAYVAFQAEL